MAAVTGLLKQATDAGAPTTSPLIAAALMYLILLLPDVRLVAVLDDRTRVGRSYAPGEAQPLRSSMARRR